MATSKAKLINGTVVPDTLFPYQDATTELQDGGIAINIGSATLRSVRCLSKELRLDKDTEGWSDIANLYRLTGDYEASDLSADGRMYTKPQLAELTGYSLKQIKNIIAAGEMDWAHHLPGGIVNFVVSSGDAFFHGYRDRKRAKSNENLAPRFGGRKSDE